MIKICNKCWKEKNIDQFYKDSSKDDGIRRYCIDCSKKYNKEHKKERQAYGKMYLNKHREKIIKNTNDYSKKRDDGLYSIYWSMRRRCKYPSQRAYRWYGAKGIKVEWNSYSDFKKDMYETFLIHLQKYGHSDTTIDRINSSKNYCKSNCRWVTSKVQHRSKFA